MSDPIDIRPFRLAHLTDPHLGPLPWPALRELMSKRFLGWINYHRRQRAFFRQDAMDAILADLRELDPDHIAVTGDLINIALPGEFTGASVWLEQLGTPEDVTLVPGNHDAYVQGTGVTRGWAAWAPYMAGAKVQADFPILRCISGIALIGLCSAVPSPPGYAYGKLGPEQLERLAKMLEEGRTAGYCRVVLVHHPPIESWSEPRKALLDLEQLATVLAAKGAELILCGHEHRLEVGAIAGPDGPIPVVAGPSTSLLYAAYGRRAGSVVFTIRGGPGRWTIRGEARRFDPLKREIVVGPIELPGHEHAPVSAGSPELRSGAVALR